ncbi:hypothetical protein MJD09_06575 [bacterium]|nr:hypothetical protein [bacterium]
MLEPQRCVVELQKISSVRSRSVEDSTGEVDGIELVDVGITEEANFYFQSLVTEGGDQLSGDKAIPEASQIRISVRASDEQTWGIYFRLTHGWSVLGR